jgi:hypothetical protein
MPRIRRQSGDGTWARSRSHRRPRGHAAAEVDGISSRGTAGARGAHAAWEKTSGTRLITCFPSSPAMIAVGSANIGHVQEETQIPRMFLLVLWSDPSESYEPASTEAWDDMDLPF